MISELLLTGAAVVVLVFLSIIKTAYESLSEISLRVMFKESEESSRARFFRELLEKRKQFELILQACDALLEFRDFAFIGALLDISESVVASEFACDRRQL